MPKSPAPFFLASLALAPLAPLGAQAPDIREWTVEWTNTRPRDPYVDARGRVWFVGQQGHYVAYLDPASGTFRRYDLDPGTGPHNLIVEPGGTVWYAGNAAAHIGKLDPATGAITKYPMPDPAARDPHTLEFDPAGDVWFTVQGGNFVGRLTRSSGEVRLVPVPTRGARPYGIRFDSRGHPWIVLFGTNKVATVDPGTMALREYTLPRAGTRPRRLEITSDDGIWYADYAEGYLGRLDPVTGEVREWLMPSGAGARPYGMAVDEHDRVWVVESGVQPNRFVGFDAKALKFLPGADVPSGGGTVRHMYYHRPTRTVWFGTDTGNIGRALLPPVGPRYP